MHMRLLKPLLYDSPALSDQCPVCLNVRGGAADGRTDGRTHADGRTSYLQLITLCLRCIRSERWRQSIAAISTMPVMHDDRQRLLINPLERVAIEILPSAVTPRRPT